MPSKRSRIEEEEPVSKRTRSRLAREQITERNLTLSLFFRLPPELRLRVYEDALGGRHIVLVVDWRINCFSEREPVEHIFSQAQRIKDNLGSRLYEDLWRTVAYRRIKAYILPNNCAQVLTKHLEHSCNTLESIPLALLRTCRTVYEEARPVLYEKNSFDFRDFYLFGALLFKDLSGLRIEAIRTIHIEWYWQDWSPRRPSDYFILDVIGRLSGLDAMHISIANAPLHSPTRWKEYRELRFFLKLKSLPLKEVAVVLDDQDNEYSMDNKASKRFCRWLERILLPRKD